MRKGMQTAWEYSQQGLVLFERGKVLYLNPQAALLLQAVPERVKGKPLMLALRNHHLEQLCRSGGEHTLELHGRSLKAQAWPGILLLIDQTLEKKRQEALEESSRMLAHEFRTPVAGVLALIEALQHGLNPAEQAEALQLMHQEVHRLARLVEDLPLHRRPQRERTFLLEELRPRLERFLAPLQQNAWIRWEIPHLVHADPDAVYQVLLNLIENALRYGPGGEVEVVSEAIGSELRLEVRDNGAALEAYEPLFEAGQRGLHAAHVRGSGLGLALVRRMAEGWEGQAYGERRQHQNIFGVSFPLVRSEYAGKL